MLYKNVESNDCQQYNVTVNDVLTWTR